MAATALARRGTSNGNQRGSATDRRKRREWLVETYRADVDMSVQRDTEGHAFDVQRFNPRLEGCGYTREPACRCYRCGALLIADTLTVDRITPGCQGGTYRRSNIRPACAGCNSETGGALASRPKKRRTKK